MEFITLLLSGHLILIFVTAFSPDENLNTDFGTVTDKSLDDFNLSDDILPSYYNITLVLDIGKDIFYGSCNISINILKDTFTQNIRLHSANLNITDSTLISEHGFKQKLRNVTYINRHEIVSLDFNSILYSQFHYTLNIIFTGIISNTGGLFKTSYVNKEGHREWLIATHNSGIGTRRLFPCWDEPRFKANFDISLKYHKNYTAFSNMLIASSQRSEEHKITRFATTPIIPTYLITIVCLSTSSIYIMGYNFWGRLQATEHLTYAVSRVGGFIQTFESNQPYMRKYLVNTYFAIPGWLDDGMDKWHIVLYREANIIYNDKIDPVARKIEISRLIARKVAGQWIGSAINSSQWSHMWLHESISTLLGINVLNKTVPDFRMMDLFVVQTLQESLRLDNTFMNYTFMDNNIFMKSLTSEVNNISEINSLFSFAHYLKGPVLLRMLQHTMGNEMFQEGINTYLKMQLSSLDSFWAAMGDAYYNKTKEDVSIKEVMSSWMNQNYYPILNVKRNENPFEIITLSTQSTSWTPLWIPVSYNTQTHINFNDTLPKTWVNMENSLLSIFEGLSTLNLNDDWIIFNLQQTGYYRVNYYTENWQAIANYLSSKNYTKVHVLNRAQIIDDAFYFMIMEQLKPSIFWKLINFLSQESDYIVWYPMFKAIEYLSVTCSHPYYENQAIKTNILYLLDPLLDKIGYEEHSEDNPLTKCLRQEAAKWACFLSDDKCLSKAKALLNDHLSNPKTEYFWPWWKEWTYCHGLSTADVTLVNKVYETYSSEKNNTKTLEFLSCSNNYSHVLSLLKKVINYNPYSGLFFNITKEERRIKGVINMFHHIVQRYAKNEEALQYILSNWKEIKPKQISSTAALIDIINHVYSWNHLNKIRKFIENVEIAVTVNHNHLGVKIVPSLRTINKIIEKSYIKKLFSRVQQKIDIRSSQISAHGIFCFFRNV